MAVNDIQREDILRAIELYDSPKGPKLLRDLHFGKSVNYRVVYEGRFYPSMPIVGIAHGIPKGRNYLPSGKLDAGTTKNTAAAIVLSRLGFFVDYKWLHMITELRPNRSHERQAAYQYVVLLWAIARARSRSDADPRLVPFSEARRRLAQLLRPFAVAKQHPTPRCRGLHCRDHCGNWTYPEGQRL